MKFSREWYEQYQARRAGVCATKPKRPARVSLDDSRQGEEKGGVVPEGRYHITFTVFNVRPLDYDNYRCKDLQDCLVKAGFLPDDNWRVLYGTVIPEKVREEAEERTEILIERIC